MSAQLFAPTTIASAPLRSNRGSWVFALGGMLAVGCAALAVYTTAAPAGLLSGAAWHQAASARPLLAFDSRTPLTHTQILRGVSGEAIPASAAWEAELAELTPAAVLATSELSLLALNRLSAGDCIALTTASGQKLSFRIIGAHTSEDSRKSAVSSNIDLAVTACSPNSEAILKAVIESKAGAKQSAVQRNL